MSYSAPYRDGWLAHKFDSTRKRESQNPYDEKKSAYSHAQWRSGWCDRFAAVKHEHPLDKNLESEYDF